MGGQGTEGVRRILREALTVRGVDPHGGVDKGKLLRQLHRRPGAVQIAAGVENQLHPLPGHGGEHLQPVGVKAPGVVMGVGIKQTHGRPSLQSRLDRQLAVDYGSPYSSSKLS